MFDWVFDLNACSCSVNTVRVQPWVTMKQGPGSYAEFLNVLWETGTITANAEDSSGKVVATDERHTLGKAAKLELTIDAPSKATGTGEAVLMVVSGEVRYDIASPYCGIIYDTYTYTYTVCVYTYTHTGIHIRILQVGQ